MKIQEISAHPIVYAEKKSKEMTIQELHEMDTEMRNIQTAENFLWFEWGYRFHIGLLNDADGIPNYKKLGGETVDEWNASFKSLKRRQAFNRRKAYLLWAQHLHELPLDAFFEVNPSKLLIVADEIEKRSGNKEKLIEILNEAADRTRKQLADTYRKKDATIYFKGRVTKVWENDLGCIITISRFKDRSHKLDHQGLAHAFNEKRVSGFLKVEE
jgi:hypothetical protein